MDYFTINHIPDLPACLSIYLSVKVCPISLVRSQQNPYSTGLGIFQICQAVKFLHETGRIKNSFDKTLAFKFY